MSRRARFAALALSALAAVPGCRAAPSPAAVPGPGSGPGSGRAAPRAVILVSIDTLRADRLNAYGYRQRATSPNLDALAKDAVLFENHVSASPWTTPSHISLFTSLLPSAHGVTRPFGLAEDRAAKTPPVFERLADDHKTLPEVLASAGYATAAFTGGVTLDPRIGFERGFARYDSSMGKLDGARMAPMLAWLDAQRDKPFFLFFHTFEVHAPYLRGEFLDDLEEEALAADGATALQADLDALSAANAGVLDARSARRAMHRRDAFNSTVASALYDGGVASADRWLGRLFAHLRASGTYDDALVIVTSDHGEQLGEAHGAGGSRARNGAFYDTHGNTLHEELVRIPLLVKLAGNAHRGMRVQPVSRAIDVMPTVLDLLGLEAPPRVQGASLQPLWLGTERAPRAAVSEALGSRREAKSLRRGRYKYVVSMSPAQVEAAGRRAIPAAPELVQLFDLARDPGEMRNLLFARGAAGDAVTARRMDAELRGAVAAHGSRPAAVPMDAEALEKLRALGYVH